MGAQQVVGVRLPGSITVEAAHRVIDGNLPVADPFDRALDVGLGERLPIDLPTVSKYRMHLRSKIFG